MIRLWLIVGILISLLAFTADAQTRPTLLQQFATQTANQCLCGPTSGGASTPGFRLQVPADIPDISATYALTVRTITAGTGLTGGGDLSTNRTLNAPLLVSFTQANCGGL